MRILTFKKNILTTLMLIFLTQNSFSQDRKTNIKQDVRYEKLLNEKRKMNSSITLSDRFKIQIFTGDNESSIKALNDFKREYKNIEGTIIFNTPIYKVWIGSFKTRIETEKKLQELKKKYPNAFLIKPNK
jgi:SPOR domain